MEAESARRAKVEHLLDLAGAYRGLSRRQLADALGRDHTKLSPPTGNPKLDYIVRLAEILDWNVGDVAEAIWDDLDLPDSADAAAGFDELNDQARAAHRAGDYRGMIVAARRMWSAAKAPQQRALAMLRESGGWDGLGRYSQELEVLRVGLSQSPAEEDTRLLLTTNLANTYFTLGHLVEGRAVARDLVERFAQLPPAGRPQRAACAFSQYVLGNASRLLASQEPARRESHAADAIRSYTSAKNQYLALADEFGNSAWRGIASTCTAGIIVCEVELARRTPADAIEDLTDGLGAVIDASDGLIGDRLESFGWWCVMGCELALRHLQGPELSRAVAIFSNKGYEIADRLNNWAMRERLFTMEYLHRQQAHDVGDPDGEWAIDQEEIKVIVGTMGRFPMFRSTGWKILQNATVVDGR
ncbi:MAG TPA: hypothetical protein VK176_09440 [Phycisphaerales bacterium]|nr:hypothetical protein [Phycisphaerales bacterium]